MDYVYTTTTVVPERVIREVCEDLINNSIHNIMGIDLELTNGQISLIKNHMTNVMDSMCLANRTSVDGWELDMKQVNAVAHSLHNHKKIEAIKTFRAATGAGLREAKDFIDKFCSGSRKETGITAAIQFRNAFES